MKPWETVDRNTILDCGKFLKVENHTVRLPDGQTIDDWPWVVTPDYVNIVAVTHDRRFLCFRQTKYAVTGTSLGPMGGYIDPGEDPLTAAQRELREETGFKAGTWEPLGTYAVDSNRGAGTAHLYLARDARCVTAPVTDDLEEQELLLLTRAELEAALDTGEIKILAWSLAFTLALRRLA